MINIDELILEESDSGDGEGATDDLISEATDESDDHNKTEQERLGREEGVARKSIGKDQL